MNTLLMLFIFVPILAALLLGLNLLFAVNKPNEAKESVYECGFNSVYGQTRSSFQIHFFIVALLFLIFDLEVLLIYPLAVTLYQVSIFGFSVALIFFIVLTIGFILEIGTGAISIKSSNILNKNNYPLKVWITNYNPHKNNRVVMIKQKATFSTSAVISTTNSFWETVYEKDRGQETNNPHIIAKRLLTKGGLTDAKKINLVQSQLGHTITQEELDKLSSIKPVSILFDDLPTLKKGA
jgi:NADH-ubiquinone oxidoreductase chain 3